MKRLLVIGLFIGFLYATPPSVSAQQECYVPFVDQASDDPSFVRFRNRLSDIIKRRDRTALMTMLDPAIKVSFGESNGKAAFSRFWELNSRRTRVWEELGLVVNNGGYMSADGGVKTFAAPYSFEGFGIDCQTDLDQFVHKVIFGKDVALRREGSLDGELITRLSYNIVETVGERTVTRETGDHVVAEWYFVKTLGGQEGYVHARYVRSPIEYRAIFQKRNNRWLMTAFVAGD
jgi:hypothetical protein